MTISIPRGVICNLDITIEIDQIEYRGRRSEEKLRSITQGKLTFNDLDKVSAKSYGLLGGRHFITEGGRLIRGHIDNLATFFASYNLFFNLHPDTSPGYGFYKIHLLDPIKEHKQGIELLSLRQTQDKQDALVYHQQVFSTTLSKLYTNNKRIGPIIPTEDLRKIMKDTSDFERKHSPKKQKSEREKRLHSCKVELIRGILLSQETSEKIEGLQNQIKEASEEIRINYAKEPKAKITGMQRRSELDILLGFHLGVTPRTAKGLMQLANQMLETA